MANLWIMVGIPGSGKSYEANKRAKENGGVVISRDNIRLSMLKEGEAYFSHEPAVFKEYVRQIDKAILLNDNVYADATQLNWASRRKLINAVHKTPDTEIKYLFMNTTFGECIARNAKREGLALIPEEVLDKMFCTLEHPEDDPYIYAGGEEVLN